ncbi:hypothetical protein RhiirA1_403560 [Rhizophagus irregularis]|uniref:Uncharacterized protein n=1 Tax=Rhizophagus irregularis TaxID=588596 RepID=A0A2N0QU01_9GLOM|nr:hypothetical protein RhiirA1_403560 [Rhizophagus irregularis]
MAVCGDLHSFFSGIAYNNFGVIGKVIDTEEINQDDEKSEVAVFTRDTLIKDVRHTLVPIEYPATSDEGIAYVYHVKIGQILKLHFIMKKKLLVEKSSKKIRQLLLMTKKMII